MNIGIDSNDENDIGDIMRTQIINAWPRMSMSEISRLLGIDIAIVNRVIKKETKSILQQGVKSDVRKFVC